MDRDENVAIEPEGGGSSSLSSSAGTRSLASIATHTRTASGTTSVASNGKLVTTWSSDIDANILEIVKKLFGK